MKLRNLNRRPAIRCSKTSKVRYTITRALWAVILMVGLNGPAIAGSLPGKLEGDATLVWGTEKLSENKKLKPVSAALQKKLRKTLKWEHYYQISVKDFALQSNKQARIPMSKKCVMVLQQIKPDQLRVKMIGEGKVVVDKKHSLKKKDALVLGGPDKDKSAWFIVLQFD